MSEYTKSHSIVGFNPTGRPKDDFYPTPRVGTTKLLEVESFSGSIWECACGDGSIGKVLSEFGYDVVASDIEPRGYGVRLDFLRANKLLAPNIVTNPPFKYSQEFMEHAFSLGVEKMALLNKIQFLEGVKRSVVLERTPLAKVWVFRKRLTLLRDGISPKGGGMITYAWFVWELGHVGKPQIGWI
jgi:hypothetical protein